MISIIVVASGSGCVGNAGAAAIVLFRVSIDSEIVVNSVVILLCLNYYFSQNDVFKKKIFIRISKCIDSERLFQ
jgi:hypothetical protein